MGPPFRQRGRGGFQHFGFLAFPDRSCRGERRGFALQSQYLPEERAPTRKIPASGRICEGCRRRPGRSTRRPGTRKGREKCKLPAFPRSAPCRALVLRGLRNEDSLDLEDRVRRGRVDAVRTTIGDVDLTDL